jgi:hypothetical protein
VEGGLLGEALALPSELSFSGRFSCPTNSLFWSSVSNTRCIVKAGCNKIVIVLGNITLSRCGGILYLTSPAANNGNGVIEMIPFPASTVVLIGAELINKLQLPTNTMVLFCLLICNSLNSSTRCVFIPYVLSSIFCYIGKNFSDLDSSVSHRTLSAVVNSDNGPSQAQAHACNLAETIKQER